MAFLIYFSSIVHQKKKIFIILASGNRWYIKTLHLVFQNGNLCGLFTFHICYKNRCKVDFFSSSIIQRVPFRNKGVIKHQQKRVYELYKQLKQN